MDGLLDFWRRGIEETRPRNSDPEAGHVGSESREVVGHRLVGRGEIPRIGAGDRAEHGRSVPGGPGHRASVVEGPTEGGDSEPADAPVGLFEADDAAGGGRTADGPPGVGADRERYEARSERRSRPGRRSRGGVVGGPGIPRRAEPGEHPTSHGELEQVELADQNGPGVIQSRSDRGLVVRDPICGGLRAVRGEDAGGREDVFGRVRDPVQGAPPPARGDFRFRFPGSFACVVAGHGDEGVDCGIRGLDVGKMGVHHFDR